jgi:ACR3 family arsenite efflux pump ArsB
MVIPMLLKFGLAALSQVKSHWRGIATTVGINWLVKPFSMALLGWLFIAHLFRPLLPPGMIDGYIAGLILLASAPCTAMVFVSQVQERPRSKAGCLCGSARTFPLFDLHRRRVRRTGAAA